MTVSYHHQNNNYRLAGCQIDLAASIASSAGGIGKRLSNISIIIARDMLAFVKMQPGVEEARRRELI